MFHPVLVISLGEIISGVSTTGFLSVFSGKHSHLGLEEKILEFQSFDQVGIPDKSSIGNSNILELLGNFADLDTTFFQNVLDSEHTSVTLHGGLHGISNFSSAEFTLGVSNFVNLVQGFHTGISRQLRLSSSGLDQFLASQRSGSSENNDIQQRVSTQSVGTMDRGTSDFSSGHESRNDDVFSVLSLSNNLGLVVSRDTTHIVMDSRQHRDGLTSSINTSKDFSSFQNTGQSFLQQFGFQVIKMEMDVITFRTNTSAFQNFLGHSTRNNISGGQILGGRSVSFHKSFTLRVSQDTSFTTASLSHQTTGTIDTSGMELNEFNIFHGQTSSGNSSSSITSTGMGTSTGLVGTTVSSGC
mmetsp:Transcript_32133/g.36466  ORF Transcript_32133/g.36466 Transcript_32133/m.36466 type:complete len:356 (-) Transcript_32133:748-1815(-)